MCKAPELIVKKARKQGLFYTIRRHWPFLRSLSAIFIVIAAIITLTVSIFPVARAIRRNYPTGNLVIYPVPVSGYPCPDDSTSTAAGKQTITAPPD